MKLLGLGVDHRSAPTAIREALAFDGPRLDDGLTALTATFPGNEFVVLSTCNRVELYLAAEQPECVPDDSLLAECLARFHGVPSATLAAHMVSYHDEGMVGHLFRVAASLESLVLGEGQILGQVRDAYQAAKARGTVGPTLHTVFQQAIRVGKKVREQTGLDQGKVSVASVAVDVAKEVFDTFHDKTVLVIGAGKMGDLTLQHLKGLRPGRILITNRNAERAEAAAARWDGQAVAFDRLGQALVESDVVVGTTAAEEPIVTLDQYARVQRARRNRLALILDIAVPRDFDPRIGTELEQVMLYNVDDLRAQVERNMRGRRKHLDEAQAIIEQETALCLAELRHRRHAGAVLQQLGDYADQVRLRELERLFSARPNLADDDRQAIAQMVHRVQNKLLHHPRAAVRSAAAATAEPSAEHPASLLTAVRQLFGLAEPTPPSMKVKDLG